MRNATLALAALALFAAPEAIAQCTGTPGTDYFEVTVREINQVPQEDIDFLNANASSLDIATIQSRLTSPFEGEVVEFQAVFLSDPILSGLATATNGIPSRIHAFVRDVDAIANGPAGQTIQIVDDSGTGDIRQFLVGEEVVVCGLVSPFSGTGGKAMQIDPISIESAENPVWNPATNPEFDDPVVASISDFHSEVNGATQINWSAFPDFNGQYVRLEGTTLVQGIAGTRADLLFSDEANGSHPQLSQYDTSVCFRNDRDDTYFPPGLAPDCIDDDFVPPPTGTINIQGFLSFQGDDGGFNYGSPDGANFGINPMEEADFEIAAAPPIVTLDPIASIPGPSDDVTVSASIVAGQGVIASADADYEYIVGGVPTSSGSISLMNTGGDTWAGDIPAGPNGALVAYTITGTDDGGNSTSVAGGYRILDGAVGSIALIQETIEGGDASLLYTEANGENNADDPIAFALDAVVQQVFQRGSSWYGSIQDDSALEPWTGIWVFFGADDPGLTIGDRINITQAAINERFDVTQLEDLTFTVTSAGAPYDYKDVPTGVLNDSDVAEAHEGMLLTFNNVTITDNDTGFGEWAFSSTGNAADEQEADDWADAFDDFDPATFFANGEVREFIRGIWWFSFGEYKLAPVLLEDIGAVVTVAVEGGIEGRTVRILGTQPNPTRTTSRVVFELDQPGDASLRVFDVTGREVITLEEGAFAGGQHTASLRAGSLAPGVYVVRLEANGEVATARLAVVR